MPDRINTHGDFVDGKCVICGCAESQKEKSCVWRDKSRPVPTSIFEDVGSIGDRAKEIRDAEDLARAGYAVGGIVSFDNPNPI